MNENDIEYVQHKQRGTTYKVKGKATVQTGTLLKDNDEVVVYRCLETGHLWVRPLHEFEDGRFVQIEGPNT